MRDGLGRTGGVLAIGLSALWALPAAGVMVFGVALLVSGRESTFDDEGFAEFFGGSMVVAGLVVLACAIAGIVLGRNLRRGRNGARVGLAALFGLFTLVSGSFLASVFADKTGVQPGGLIGFGLNTAICLVVVFSAVFGRPGSPR
jgi:ABC-type Fe3+ transport system permease subunit